jgi:exopolyphosphatase / guanosine-5'-triphosphate,3'-diphosphate pyrophosphatase
LPPALVGWTAPLFVPPNRPGPQHLREAACWLSDIGCRDHPEFRAEQAFLRVLRYPGIGLDHHARAFLALTVALRYEAESDAPFLRPARLLLDVASAHAAEVLGVALRLAYTLSGGTRALLAGSSLEIAAGRRLVLHLRTDAGVFAGEAVMRRLDRLAQALGLEAGTDVVADLAA